MHDMQPPAISRRLQTAMTHTAAAGYAEVLSYGADSDVDILQAALEDMLLQPRVSVPSAACCLHAGNYFHVLNSAVWALAGCSDVSG